MCTYGHLLFFGYKWDYTFYQWGYKYLKLVKGHDVALFFHVIIIIFQNLNDGARGEPVARMSIVTCLSRQGLGHVQVFSFFSVMSV
jgi:hypothetical protein